MRKEEGIERLKQRVKEIKEESKIKEQRLEECKKETKKEDDKDEKIAELTETLQRLQAEFENYKKYVEKSKADFIGYAKAAIIEELLPILDSFELALRNTTDKEKFVKGVELIYSQLYSMLEKEGLKKIDTEGKFNHNMHEVLLKEESDKEEDTILEELQKGYVLGGKVLRYSKVKVSKKKSANGDKQKNTTK